MLIVLEGGEGAGKSTIARELVKRFGEASERVLVLREPGGTALGEAVRILLREPLAPWAEAFAFIAARSELVSAVMAPALAAGTTVLCDRFSASTISYQGYGRGLDLAVLTAADRAARGGIEPHLTVYLDVDPEAGIARKSGEMDPVRTGREPLDFHRRVRAGYLRQAEEASPGRWVTIDAARPLEHVMTEAWAAITRLFQSRKP